MLVMTEDKAKALGLQPIAVLDSFGASGVAPSIMVLVQLKRYIKL